MPAETATTTTTQEIPSDDVAKVVAGDTSTAEPKGEPKVDTKAQDTPKGDVAADVKKEPKVKTAADGDDVELDDNERVNLPFTTFQKRLKQAGRATLRALFGTDNEKDIQDRWKAGQEAATKLDKIKKDQMSEVERHKTEAAEARARAEAAEAQLAQREADQSASKGEAIVRGVAGKYIGDGYVDDAMILYSRHLSGLDDDELEALEAKDIDKWFREYVEKRPAMARETGKSEKKTETRGINNGAASARKPDDARSATSNKTPRPGQANSMTASEWEQYKREHGFSF